MAASLLGGAAVGAVFGELLKAVMEMKDKAVMFKPTLAYLRTTLIAIDPVIKEIQQHNNELGHPKEELELLIREMEEGTKLVYKCSKIHKFNIYARLRYQDQLVALVESLVRFFIIDMQAQSARDLKETLLKVRRIHSAINKLPLVSTEDMSGSSDAVSVPVPVSVPVISDSGLPSSHDQSLLVDSALLNGKNSQRHIIEIFEYSELEEATNNFDLSRILGIGLHETMYYGILEDGRHIAVKRGRDDMLKSLRLQDEKLQMGRLNKFMKEVGMFTCLSCLRHENLVQQYGYTSPLNHELLLVEEHIPNGSVAHLLLGTGSLPWSTRLNIATQTASALAYLHASNIIHGNGNTTYILLDGSLNAKVAACGLSRLLPHGVTHVTTDPAGTPGYIDPEYYECCHLSDKSDVYSFGVILIELISSLPAFSEDDKDPFLSDFAMKKISSGRLRNLVDPALGFESDDWITETINAVAQLAFTCLQSQSKLRPSMEEVLNTLESIRSGSSQSALT